MKYLVIITALLFSGASWANDPVKPFPDKVKMPPPSFYENGKPVYVSTKNKKCDAGYLRDQKTQKCVKVRKIMK